MNIKRWLFLVPVLCTVSVVARALTLEGEPQDKSLNPTRVINMRMKARKRNGTPKKVTRNTMSLERPMTTPQSKQNPG